MASAFSDSLIASGGWGGNILHRSQKLQKVWLWIFTTCWYPYGVTKSKKVLTYLAWSVQSRLFKVQFLGMLTSRNILQDCQYQRQKLILKISDQYLKDWLLYRTICKMPKSWSLKFRTAHIMRTRSCDFTKFTGWCHVINI